jgi:hypothetical protein
VHSSGAKKWMSRTPRTPGVAPKNGCLELRTRTDSTTHCNHASIRANDKDLASSEKENRAPQDKV